tara:strand:+ start:200 stop:790 length:591 start_codon:yes stop_codon:yes gene_type:complete
MSGEFTRLDYDELAYVEQQQRSLAPGDYRLFEGSYENCSCYPFNQPANSREQVSTVRSDSEKGFGSLAEIESQLTNRVNPHTKHNKVGKNDDYKQNKVHHKVNCNNYLETEDSRFTDPLDNYRGMSLTDYYLTPYLHVNPQCYVQSDGHREGTSSRLHVRDCYNPKPSKKWDNGEALPPTPKKDPNENKDCKMCCK